LFGAGVRRHNPFAKKGELCGTGFAGHGAKIVAPFAAVEDCAAGLYASDGR
jgi:hypothetical protein